MIPDVALMLKPAGSAGEIVYSGVPPEIVGVDGSIAVP